MTWGKLTRSGGSEDVQAVPGTIQLVDTECFFGRFEHPVKTPDSKFTHSTQIVLNCMFVSSTHFSISISGDRDSSTTYTIADYSRNGTYLDGELIGPNLQKKIHDGAVISLMYKNKARVSYVFSAGQKQVVSPGGSIVGKEKNEAPPAPRDDEESARFASMKSQADSATEALTRQIAVLQQEGKRSEQRIQQLSGRVEASAAELEKANSKAVALEKHVEALQKEKEDLSERLSSSEANTGAVEARNCKLLEQMEDVRGELKDLRTKNALLSEDLQAKTAQLESRNDLMQNNNKALAHENKKWAKLEKKYEDACERIREVEEYSARVTTANQALQGVTADQESTIARLRAKNEKLHALLTQGCAVVKAREVEVLAMHNSVAAAVQSFGVLMAVNQGIVNRSAYFDDISNQLTAGSLAASPQSDSSQENTYAEGSFNRRQLQSPNASQQAEGGPPLSANTQVSVFNRTPSNGGGPKIGNGTNVYTGNGAADSISSYSHASKRGNNGDDADGDSNPGNGHSHGGNISMDIAEDGLPAHSASLTGDKRKRGEQGQDDDDEEEDVGPASKMSTSVTRPGATLESIGEENEGAERGDQSQQGAAEGEMVAEEEDEDAEDMQRTQAPATFAHLFEDQSVHSNSDGEEEEREKEKEEGGAVEAEAEVVEAPTAHKSGPTAAETIDLMDDSDVEDSGKPVVGGAVAAPKRSQSAGSHVGEIAQQSFSTDSHTIAAVLPAAEADASADAGADAGAGVDAASAGSDHARAHQGSPPQGDAGEMDL